MIRQENNKELSKILDKYYLELNWLRSLITDPTGKRYLENKQKDERLKNMKFSFEKMASLLEFMDNPQNEYPAIHIAGTGGKGSVSMMIGAILQEADFKTGIHTSPYLQIPNEKWLLDKKLISPSKFSSAIEKFRLKYNQFTLLYPDKAPTYVLAQVALTHQIFAEEKIDWGIIEAGMGGRYDSTNHINSKISIITNIDFDHVNALGPTLEDITYHKAGIIKTNVPVITGVKQNNLLEIIKKEAQEKKAPLFLKGRDFDISVENINQDNSKISIKTPYNLYNNINISLSGSFQAENAALAVTACDILANSRGISIDKEVINQALSNIRFAGRMETVQKNPLTILDGAHNPQKMNALAESIKMLYPKKDLFLIIGMLASKDAFDSLYQILPQTTKVIATEPNVIGKPSIKANDLSKIIKRISPNLKILTVNNATEAVNLALTQYEKNDLILITGSIYMLGEAREHWYPKEEMLINAELS